MKVIIDSILSIVHESIGSAPIRVRISLQRLLLPAVPVEGDTLVSWPLFFASESLATNSPAVANPDRWDSNVKIVPSREAPKTLMAPPRPQ